MCTRAFERGEGADRVCNRTVGDASRVIQACVWLSCAKSSFFYRSPRSPDTLPFPPACHLPRRPTIQTTPQYAEAVSSGKLAQPVAIPVSPASSAITFNGE